MEIGTIIDVVLAFVFMVSIVSGWHQGLVMKVASLIVVVICFLGDVVKDDIPLYC